MFSLGRRGLAFILCVLLGILGVHRMYVGKWKSGLIMLFCTGLNVLTIFTFFRFHPEGSPVGALFFVLRGVSMLFWGVIAVLVFDLVLIVAGRFTNKAGERLTDW